MERHPPVRGAASVAPSSGQHAGACVAFGSANEPAAYRSDSLLSLPPQESDKHARIGLRGMPLSDSTSALRRDQCCERGTAGNSTDPR